MLLDVPRLAAFVLSVLGAGAAPPASPPAPEPRRLAAAQVANLDALGEVIQAALRQARADGEPERSACLDEVLTRAHVAARGARSFEAAIADALLTGDDQAVTRDLGRLELLGERAGRLRAEARACEGKSVERVEGTRVVVYAPVLPDAAAYPGGPAGR